MRGFAKTTLLGTLTKDPELRTTKNGKSVASFSIAVNRKSSGETEESVSFFNCTAWNQGAETLSKYATKGQTLLIECEPQQRSWEQDGQKRSVIEFTVQTFVFVGGEKNRPLKQHEVLEKARDDEPTDEEVDNTIDLSSIPF